MTTPHVIYKIFGFIEATPLTCISRKIYPGMTYTFTLSNIKQMRRIIENMYVKHSEFCGNFDLNTW